MPTDHIAMVLDTQAVKDVVRERVRQITKEGYSPQHDADEHPHGELAMAAACYAAPDLIYVKGVGPNVVSFRDPWPFQDGDKRLKVGGTIAANYMTAVDKRRDLLVKAGALILAEIERIDGE